MSYYKGCPETTRIQIQILRNEALHKNQHWQSVIRVILHQHWKNQAVVVHMVGELILEKIIF